MRPLEPLLMTHSQSVTFSGVLAKSELDPQPDGLFEAVHDEPAIEQAGELENTSESKLSSSLALS